MWARGAVIQFAHRTFEWASDARGKAAVHCVIVGFGLATPPKKWLYDYATPQSAPSALEVTNINGYLIEGPNIALPSRTDPQPGFPQMLKGSQPTDGGFLVLDQAERRALVSKEPGAGKWLKKYVGGEELIDGTFRWCLWLKGIKPNELKALPEVRARVAGVKASRLKSPTKSVQQYAAFPTLFTQDRQPNKEYLALPEVSSETRRFIPMALLPSSVIASNKLQMMVGASLFHFGILSSTMHMAWVRHVGGRLESRFSYAPSVYNNFPFPRPNSKQLTAIETAAQGVLAARAAFAGMSLGTLYDPITMPPALVAAHAKLDSAVDKAYRKKAFAGDLERMEFLFTLYQAGATPLLPAAGKKKKR
jgi:hypothetical protein